MKLARRGEFWECDLSLYKTTHRTPPPLFIYPSIHPSIHLSIYILTHPSIHAPISLVMAGNL